jgi:hypothetical protein
MGDKPAPRPRLLLGAGVAIAFAGGGCDGCQRSIPVELDDGGDTVVDLAPAAPADGGTDLAAPIDFALPGDLLAPADLGDGGPDLAEPIDFAWSDDMFWGNLGILPSRIKDGGE